MLNTLESIFIVLGAVAGSAAFLLLLRRVWRPELRRLQNDLIGWHVTVLGTTYAVIIGFMLYAVWTNFETADANAEAEANSLVNAVRAARGLPVEQRQQIRNLAAEYVEIMLTEEWPSMRVRKFSPRSHQIVKQLWEAVSSAETRTSREQTSLDHTLSELSSMTEHRRLRQLEVLANLPEILWLVLILGAAITIISACLFGTSDLKIHLTQVIMLALMLSSVLVTIADINHPFQGSVHVAPGGFERARATIADMQ